MTQFAQNRRVLLTRRPHGLPTLDDFRLAESAIPELKDGEVLLRTVYLSLDPYMRQLMDEVGPVYAPSVALGGVMPGSTVSRIVSSRHPRLRTGELVLANAGWQEFAVSDGSDLLPLPPTDRPSLALGGLGMPGFTAYVGLLDIGQPRPGETVVVAAATGAVGSVVGQLAKIKGARVVGIAGSAEKSRYAVETLGFDACVNRRDVRFADELAAACPNGIDVYFENVGGEVFGAVLRLLNIGARIPVSGHIADYNHAGRSTGQNLLPALMAALVQKRIRMQGFVILDHYADRLESFRRDMQAWYDAGTIKLREDVVPGLEQAPAAFIRLLEGQNFGKLVVEIAS